MQFLRSAAYAVIFYPATLVFILGCAIALIGGGGAQLRTTVKAWARFHYWLVRKLLRIRIRVEGALPDQPSLIAVKHESMLETLEMVRIANAPVVVLKRELSRLPAFGWATRAYGVIPVDREAGAKALRQMLVSAQSAVEQGRPVLIFPEGTRVEAGTKPPLRSGFAGLYRALGLPVVPVAVDSGRLWGRNFVKRPGTVTFRIGAPIPPGLKRQEVERRVHAAINALVDSAP